MSSLQDIADVVVRSSNVGINMVQLAGNEKSEVYVPMYDWVTFLQNTYRKLPGIKSQHHFTISADEPDVVIMKEYVDSTPVRFTLRVGPIPEGMPQVIPAPGLNSAQQKYLFEKIRPFCDEDKADVVCPAPTTPMSDSENEEIPQQNVTTGRGGRRGRGSRGIRQMRGRPALRGRGQVHSSESSDDESDQSSVGSRGRGTL